MRRIASRMNDIQPFHVMALLGRAKALQAAGHDVIHLEIGEPDFPAPAPVLAAGIRALEQGLTHYTPAAGLTALRAAIAGHYARRFGVEVSPSRILVTPGASGALGLVTGLLFNPGEQVMLADPGYPCNAHFLRLINAVPQRITCGPDVAFQLDAAAVSEHWEPATRGVLVATPSNPTGTLIPASGLAALHAAVRERDGVLIVDEIYQGLTYGSESVTALALPGADEDVFVINSFSKYFGMTGWRVGWIVAPEWAVEPLERMAQNFFLAAATPSQHAALAAFLPETTDILEQRRNEMRDRRDFLLSALPALGFSVPVVPEGAFYLYCDVSAVTDDSFRFCERLLESAHVAVTPGRDFACHDAGRYLRIAYTAPVARLQEAVARMASFMAGSG